MADLTRREWAIMAPMAAVALWMGIYPAPFLAPLQAPVDSLIARLERADPPQTPFTPVAVAAVDSRS
jgi:NADH-quinone oxidoreductase subunit M